MSIEAKAVAVLVGERVRCLRDSAMLTQQELAQRAGIPRGVISRIECGRHTPSLPVVMRLAAALGRQTSSVINVLDGEEVCS